LARAFGIFDAAISHSPLVPSHLTAHACSIMQHAHFRRVRFAHVFISKLAYV
jgi:hypothetical protein